MPAAPRSRSSRCFALRFSPALGLPAAAAQTIPPQGTAATFDVGSWNLEWFGTPGEGPTNEELQFQNALAVFRQSEVDLWGLYELNDPPTWDRLVDSLRTFGFDGYRVISDPGTGEYGYGYVWRTGMVTPIQFAKVLTSYSFEFAGRPPLQMRATIATPDTTLEVRFLCLHAKAGGTLDDYERRVEGAIGLKNYVDNLLAVETNVMVIGDLNDELRFSIASGRPSPYAPFVSDADDYLFGTYGLDVANLATYCSSSNCTSGSTLDHVLLTRTLLDDYVENSTDRYIELIAALPGYVNNTSDHLPVFAQLDFASEPVAAEPSAPTAALALDAPFPNPTDGGATVTFRLDRPSPIRLDVFDALGRRVAVLADGAFGAGTHTARLDGATLTPGLYLVRLTAGNAATGASTLTRRLAVTR